MFRILALACAMLLFFTASAETDVRVLLKSLGSPSSLKITLQGSYSLDAFPAQFDEGAQITLSGSDDGVLLRSGGMEINMGPSVTLLREDGGIYMEETLYNGDLTVTSEDDCLRPVLKIGVEEYLCGVVAHEMSDAFPIEALKAQAVAARTYALSRISDSRDYDLTDTTSDQVFRGFNPEHENVIAAVDATRGVTGMYNGDYATCFYTASNGGEIALPRDAWGGDGDYGYITRKADPYDLENPRSLVNSLTFKSDLSDCAALRKMLEEATGCEVTRVLNVTPVRPDPAGSRRYAYLRFAVETENGMVCTDLPVFGGIKEALSLGLNSGDHELISVTRTEGGFTLQMRRFGHGVGMSQRGAQRMAGTYGMTWQEILAFYYPGMTLTKE